MGRVSCGRVVAARRCGRPGGTLVIDWREEKIADATVQVFFAVLAWLRFWFVRFAADRQQATTLG